jgi:uncharacterized protein YgbK (DUF1537 family)
MGMPKNILLILADDLTGSLDTGIQFAKNNIATGVFLSENRGDFSGTEIPDVIVINTDTRHRSPDEARKIIARLAERYKDTKYVYKKTDSTLRGNIGAELEALLEARGAERLSFVPAYPDLGRTTLGGRQYLGGKPIHKTAVAGDALNPVRKSFIPGIIKDESDLPVRLVPLGDYRELLPAPPVREEGQGSVSEKRADREILVFDCLTNEQMGEIARFLKGKNLLGLSAGCAGFAGALMEVLPFSSPEKISEKKRLWNGERRNLPILILSGSRHPVSLEQVKTALDGGVRGIPVSGEKLTRPGWFAAAEAEALAGEYAAVLNKDRVCVAGTRLAMGLPEDGEQAEKPPASRGPDENVAGRLGGLVRKIIEKTGPLNLVIFGGDTLLGIMEALEFDYMTPLAEIRPGIVLAQAQGKKGSSFIVTKSGAFGEPEMIGIIREYLGR